MGVPPLRVLSITFLPTMIPWGGLSEKVRRGCPVDSLFMGMISVHKVSAFSFCNKFPDQVPKELFVRAVNSSLIGILITNIHNCGRRGGLTVSALDSGASGPGSSPG